LGSTRQDAAGANGVHGDTALRQGHREVPDQRVQRSLGGSHADPWLPTSGVIRIGNRNHAAAIPHHAAANLRCDKKGCSLRIHSGAPVVEGDLHGWAVKAPEIWPRATHENVELAELFSSPLKHAADIFGRRDVGFNDETIGSMLADFRQRIVRCPLILVVVNGYVDAMLRQLQRDASADPAGASGDESVFKRQWHGPSPP